MVRRVALLAIIGLAIGLGGALLLTPYVGSLLLGVPPNDPASFATVSVMLALVAARYLLRPGSAAMAR